jgi:hypothetical protein
MIAPAAIEALALLVKEALDIRRSLLQKGELTPEQNAAYTKLSESVMDQEHWKPE